MCLAYMRTSKYNQSLQMSSDTLYICLFCTHFLLASAIGAWDAYALDNIISSKHYIVHFSRCDATRYCDVVKFLFKWIRWWGTFPTLHKGLKNTMVLKNRGIRKGEILGRLPRAIAASFSFPCSYRSSRWMETKKIFLATKIASQRHDHLWHHISRVVQNDEHWCSCY